MPKLKDSEWKELIECIRGNRRLGTSENHIRILLIGGCGAGKSVVLNRFISGKFAMHYPSTVGAEFRSKEIISESNTFKLEIWDTSGQDRYRPVISPYTRGTNIAILFFDLTNLKSLKELEDHFNALEDLQKTPLKILVGTKSDLVTDREVIASQVLSLIKHVDALDYLECSAKTGEGIEQIFLSATKLVTAARFSFLDLSRTDIDAKQLKELCLALKINTSLKKIDLSKNNLKEKDIKQILEALKEHKAINEIILDKNQTSTSTPNLLDSSTQTLLDNILSRNRKTAKELVRLDAEFTELFAAYAKKASAAAQREQEMLAQIEIPSANNVSMELLGLLQAFSQEINLLLSSYRKLLSVDENYATRLEQYLEQLKVFYAENPESFHNESFKGVIEGLKSNIKFLSETVNAANSEPSYQNIKEEEQIAEQALPMPDLLSNLEVCQENEIFWDIESVDENLARLQSEQENLEETLKLGIHQKQKIQDKLQQLQLLSERQIDFSKLENLQKQINNLQRQVHNQSEKNRQYELLLANKKAKQEAIAAFKNSPNQLTFYKLLIKCLENLFLGTKCLDNKFLETIGKVGTSISVIGKLLALIPMFGSEVDIVAEAVSKVLQKLDKIRQTNILKAIARLNTLGEMQKEVERTARQLTYEYRDILNEMPTLEEEVQQTEAHKNESKWNYVKQTGKGLAERGKEIILKEKVRSSVERLVDVATSRILGELLDGNVEEDKELAEHFVQTVKAAPESKLDTIKQILLSVFKLHRITTHSGKEWQLEEIFYKPAIKTKAGLRYSGGLTDPDTYYYRLGTDQEAIELGLTLENVQANKEKSETITSTSDLEVRITTSTRLMIEKVFTKLQPLMSEIDSLLSQYNQQPNADKKYVAEMQSYIQEAGNYYTMESSSSEIEQAIIALTFHQQRLKELIITPNQNLQQEIISTPNTTTKSTNKPFATLEISFHIAQEELKLGKELGRGGFGIVFQGTWRYNDVAIKQLQSTQLSKDALEEFQSEMKIMARLRSPNIVQLYGITDKTPYCMVMEYLPKGDLYNLLHSNESLSWEQRAQMALDIARGLAYLHHENILHRDLKSKNVLLDSNLKAKLADFGLAKIKTESSITSTGKIVGTLAWMAPELFKRKAQYTLKADMYSYGMVVWELSSRKIPFEDAKGNQSLIAKWVSEGEREEIPKETPKKLAQLIEASWSQEPEKRPTAAKAIEQLQTEDKSSAAINATKPGDYRSNFDSTAMDSGYRDNLDSDKSFRP